MGKPCEAPPALCGAPQCFKRHDVQKRGPLSAGQLCPSPRCPLSLSYSPTLHPLRHVFVPRRLQPGLLRPSRATCRGQGGRVHSPHRAPLRMRPSWVLRVRGQRGCWGGGWAPHAAFQRELPRLVPPVGPDLLSCALSYHPRLLVDDKDLSLLHVIGHRRCPLPRRGWALGR